MEVNFHTTNARNTAFCLPTIKKEMARFYISCYFFINSYFEDVMEIKDIICITL